MKILQDWDDELKDTESKAFKDLSERLKTGVKTINVFMLHVPLHIVTLSIKPFISFRNKSHFTLTLRLFR